MTEANAPELANGAVPTILLVDDDSEDTYLAQEAMGGIPTDCDVEAVQSVQDMMAYLRREAPFAHLADARLPALILLDLHMPGQDGREGLRQIKADERFGHIPVIALTGSQEQTDVAEMYQLGASSYIVKPGFFDEWQLTMTVLCEYWIDMVRGPATGTAEGAA